MTLRIKPTSKALPARVTPGPRRSPNGYRSPGAARGGRGSNPAAERPIGVFDSGIGGLTVLKELVAALPRENFVYLGDTARLPYGTKSNEVIIKYSRENTEFLLAKGIKMLVIACNTSSAVALERIAGETAVPVIGVIEPGARAAAKVSRSGKIGVIGTEATIASGAYTRAIQTARPRAEIYTRACPLLVPLVEEGFLDNEIAEKIVDSATATADAVRDRLEELGIASRMARGAQSFFVTESPDRFVRVGRRFFGPEVESAVRIER